ncbi:hypothetical protein CTI12_AA542700 [Artemisia annua]|uniref:Zinc knuckle CX2CX4HX4C n=1 Tax=Artemisia annua TaxID=35608 RepID=A0A2U1L0X7_ARTAN|nr:hypothetical protein CTI12_AA542700 [Artemisia annua]
MDHMTTSICDKQYGRASFARVLVEIESSKPLVDSVELWYESLGKVLRLGVEYSWVPPRCEECKTFGHYYSECARKINVARAVNKDGDTVKSNDVKNGGSSSGAGNVGNDEGWKTAVNRRNSRGNGINAQGSLGGYQTRSGGYVSRSMDNNISNANVKLIRRRNLLRVNGTSGNVEAKKNVQKKNLGNKSGNRKGNSGNNGDNGSSKEVFGAKNVSMSNRFDVLGQDNVSNNIELWNEVKVQVTKACTSGVPILESVVKGWSEDMVKFYTEQWNNRVMMSGSREQQLEFKIKGLSNQISYLNRNINRNVKLNAAIRLKNLGVTNNLNKDASYRYLDR